MKSSSILGRLLIAAMFVVSAVETMIPTAVHAANANDLLITLKGSAQFPRATGKAKYQNRNRQQELQVEVENVAQLKGQRVAVFVGSTQVGIITISNLGKGSLNLRTAVPVVTAKSAIQVVTTSGVVIVSN
ncbi:MAG: hypothetical protein U0941_23910 [Planctomycetaceae bacterium]